MSGATPPPNIAASIPRVWKDWFAKLKPILDATTVSVSNLLSKYSIKVTAGGAIAGIGLIADANTATPTSAVIIQADKFAIVDSTYSGGATNTPAASSIMFAVDTDGAYLKGNLKVNGKAVINGSTTLGSQVSTLHVNPTYSSVVGLTTYCNSVDGAALVGTSGTSGGHGVLGTTNYIAQAGVWGASGTAGAWGVRATHYSGGYALKVEGLMAIDNSTVVTNLNAEKWNGNTCANTVTTGSSTATFSTTNKPGSHNNTQSWLQVVINGATYYIPVWAD